MEHQVVSYIKKHTFTIAVLVTAGFFLLGMGEVYLYKQQMQIKQMISEGFMQVKEMDKPMPTPTETPMQKQMYK